MRRVIREDILGKSYRCHVAVNVYEENEMSEYELTNKDSNSEKSLVNLWKSNMILALQLTTFHKTQGIFNFIFSRILPAREGEAGSQSWAIW